GDFQHYRDRDPPWIKLYRDILTSEAWLCGTDTTRLVQIASMLLAARYRNKIPLKMTIFKQASHLAASEGEIKAALQYLTEQKFLTIDGVEDESPLPASDMLATCATVNVPVYSSQGNRIQGNGSEGSAPLAKPPDPVAIVFDHWRTAWKKPKAALDVKRRAFITKALKSYSVEDLCRCISGYLNSDFHRGLNDRNTAYDDIGLFLRDSSK